MTLHESSPLQRHKTSADVTGGREKCKVCSREPRIGFVPLSDLDPEVAGLIRANAPGAEDLTRVCRRCARIFAHSKDAILEDAALKKDGSNVLSTPLRLDALERYTGKGATIAFLDSGFYPHPDLTKPEDRIIGYRSLLHSEGDDSQLYEPDVASWHGMMTSVVAVGNGWLSNGFYRGLAPDANVVLVKLARTGRITEQNIQDGLEWVLENRSKYGINVVNISAGGDFEQSYLHDSLSRVVEECVQQGIVVVCAVGNAGDRPNHPVFPPASSPSCISVGGLDDNNSLDRSRRGMYRSSYGPTMDGLQKPEVIAPSIWVPAPILPGTPTAKQAEFLEQLDKADDEDLHDMIRENPGIVEELDAALDRPVHSLRQIIVLKLRQENVINKYYKYVDGTSFSSPIVSSVVAQMIEANPNLTAQEIKRILITTAERLPNYDVDRQGWGVIDPRQAVETAESLAEED